MSSPLRKLQRCIGRCYRTESIHPRAGLPPERKMSEVLLEFAEPLLDGAVDDSDYRAGIGFAVMFWDLALLPEEEQPEALKHMARDLGKTSRSNDPEIVEYFQRIGKMLLLRKKALFPDITRAILDYEIVGKGETIQLLITSTAP